MPTRDQRHTVKHVHGEMDLNSDIWDALLIAQKLQTVLVEHRDSFEKLIRYLRRALLAEHDRIEAYEAWLASQRAKLPPQLQRKVDDSRLATQTSFLV